MIYPNRLNYRQIEERPKAFWGALIGAAASLVGGLISSSSQARAQKRAMEEQQRLAQQQLEVSNQNNLAATLNNYASAQNSYDTNDYNLKYRNGGTRRLGSNGIVITDGGNAKKIGSNTFLLRGGSHEDINETGQTGIGINVGGNEIEAEGGEVAQKKNGSLRIFSAQPMLSGGLSPAQAILRGYNKDKVFAAQQRFKRNNHLNDDGSKAKTGTVIPYKRIHIDKDGNMIDTLNGKSYTASATNGEDVVITGKANHWKEAGKKDTSSYFDPMGAVTFANAASAPILNFTPSNIVGSIREAKDYNSFMNSFMNNNNGGFFTKNYAEKHPYISFLGNMLADAAAGGLGNKGINLVRGRMNYAPYRKLTYKANKLAKKTGLVIRNSNFSNESDYINNAEKTVDNIVKHNPKYYTKKLGTDDQLKYLNKYYSRQGVNNKEATMNAVAHLPNDATNEKIERLAKIYQNNPEYLEFINQSNGTINPLSQESVDTFLKRQGRSIRGVHANNLRQSKFYLTTTQKGRYMPGGDRLDTNGGLYTSNSPDIADRFKNPEVGESNGYVGDLQFDFNVDKTKPIEDQLYQARNQILFDPSQSGGRYLMYPINPAINREAYDILKSNPRIRAIEANYGRSNGNFLPSNERGYLPSRGAFYHEVETPVKLNNIDEYTSSKNKRGRWGSGNTSDDLFIGQIPNNTTDYIRDARILLSRVPDNDKIFFLRNDVKNNRYSRIKYRNSLSDKTVNRYVEYQKPNDEPYKYPRLTYMIDKMTPNIYRNFRKAIDNYRYWNNSETGKLGGVLGIINKDLAARYNGNVSDIPFGFIPIKNKRQAFTKAIKDTYGDKINSIKYKTLTRMSDKVNRIINPKKYKAFKEAGFDSVEDYDKIMQKLDDDYSFDVIPEDEYIEPFRLGGKARRKSRLGSRCKFTKGGKIYTKPNYYHWMHQTSDNLKVTPIDNTYDYRAYYDSATPWELANTMYNANNGHFTDIGKRPSHPTFSNESKYSNYKTPGGTWNDDVFVPSIWQFGNNGNKIRNMYMNNTGEGYFDGRRNVFPRSKKIYGGKDDNGRNSKKTVHFYKSKSGRVFKTIKEAAQDNYNYNNNVGYRITTKENNYNKSLTKKDINIPFIKSKAITLSNAGRAIGAKLSTNQLDSIAKYANRAGLSIPKAFGLVMKESTFNNPTVGHVQFIQNENTQNNESNRWINNNNWTYKRNPYTEAIDAANKNEKNKTIKDWDNQVINGEKYADKLAKKLKAQPFTVGIEDGFRKYKTNPYKYNPGQKNYVQLVNQNARDIMNSPQIRQWYKTSPYAKGRRYKCGGITTPRRRYADGGITDLTGTTVYGRNRFNTSAWDNYMKNKALGFMNNMSIPNTPYQQSSYTPQVQSYLNLMSTPFTGRQSSFKPATQDYIGLGIDTLAALGSGFFTRNAYNKLNFNYNLPSYVDETPVAFDTTYHNEAQRANVERNRINGRNLIQGNTASAQTALSRMQQGDTNAMMELNKLADEKANKEVELRNQNAANEQQVRARNAAARNQYYQNIAQIQNAALEAKNNAALAKAQSIGADLSGLAQAWSNFATSVENRYDSRQNQIAMVASANNPAVTQTALRMGYDFSPETLAGLYNTTNDENMKRLILSKMSTRDRIKYGIK